MKTKQIKRKVTRNLPLPSFWSQLSEVQQKEVQRMAALQFSDEEILLVAELPEWAITEDPELSRQITRFRLLSEVQSRNIVFEAAKSKIPEAVSQWLNICEARKRKEKSK